jgi:PAS domain S-box-containing protein
LGCLVSFVREVFWRRLAWVTIAVGLSATWLVTDWVMESRLEAERTNFVRLADVLEVSFNERTRSAERLLSQVAEVLRRSSMSLDEWRRYAASLESPKEIPGVVSIGIMDEVQSSQVDLWQREWTNSRESPLKVDMKSKLSVPAPILVRAWEPPLSRGGAYRGYDLARDPAYSRVLKDTLSRVKAGLLPRLNFSDDAKAKGWYVFVHPVKNLLREQDSAILNSWVFAAIDPQIFLSRLIQSDTIARILGSARVEIFEGDEPVTDALLYSNIKGTSDRNYLLSRTMPLTVGGQVWLARLALSGPTKSSGLLERNFMYIAGAILTLLASALFFILSTTKQSALEQAAKLTANLAASEARFRSLSTASPIGIFMTDSRGRVFWANEKFLAFAAVNNRAFAPGLPWWTIATEESLNPIEQRWTSGIPELEERFRLAGAVGTWLSVRISPVRNLQNEIQAWVGTATDISREVEVLSASDQSLHQILSIIENAPVAMAMLDENLVYLGASSQWKDEFGISVANLVGENLQNTMPDHFRQFCFVIQTALNQQSTIHKNEEQFTLPDGKPVFKRWAIHPWSAGDRRGLVVCAFNITELVGARALAEEHAKFRAEFLSHMSHELRNPLTSIIGGVAMLSESKLDPEQTDIVQSLDAASSMMLTIADDVLDLAKLEAGKFTLESSPFDLSESIQQAVSAMRPRAVERGLKLELLWNGEAHPRIVGDAARLRQVCVNLVANAIKFTPSGSVVCSVNIQVAPSGGVAMRMEVRDTGIGMSREAQAKLFRKFSQADDSTARRFGGTGLGLSIVKEIVDLMGGEVGAVSEENKGSTFWVEITFESAREESRAA